jgi:hypothetical protein
MKSDDPAPQPRARATASGVTSKDREPADHYVRRLARDHCRGAMRALAAVAKDTDSPASARITAATSLVAWTLGYPPDGAPPTAETSGGRRGTPEQVVRLSWMESKNQKRSQSRRPKPGPERAGAGKESGDKKAR